MGNGKKALRVEEVAATAERCFEKFGVHRTSMKDVADELGVTRQTVYRLFENRNLLLEYIADRRIIELGKNLKKDFDKLKNLEEALVEGSLLSLQAGRSDALLTEITQNSSQDFDQFLFRGTADIQKVMLSLWSSFLDQAREEGKLRDGISNDQAVEWIRNCHAVANIRDDMGPDEYRTMFQTFLVPSILKDEH